MANRQLTPFELSQASWSRWLSLVALDWAVIALTLAAARSADHLIGYWFATLIIGTRQHAIALMGHDGAHFVVSKNKRINDFITGAFAFWPLGIGLNGYRNFHFKHHQKVGTPDDPELKHKRWAEPEFALPLKKGKLWIMLAKDLMGFGFRDLIRLIRLTPPAAPMDVIGPMVVWSIILSGLWLFDQLWVLPVWFLSMGTSFWAVFRLRIWTEHVGTSGTHRVLAGWMERLIYMPHNTWCHFEHHMWPSIPCWNLPKARALENRTEVLSIQGLHETLKNSPPLASGDLPGEQADLSGSGGYKVSGGPI